MRWHPLVHSLNAPAAEGAVPGDAKAGEQFFFSKGQCTSCHMVQGRGVAVGPDLSECGTRSTIEEIRESLLQPGARAATGYELVTVQLRDGRSLRGFVRSRSNFDLHLQDLEGRIHSLSKDQMERIEPERRIAHAAGQGKPRRTEQPDGVSRPPYRHQTGDTRDDASLASRVESTFRESSSPAPATG